jgi:hypothetical protein
MKSLIRFTFMLLCFLLPVAVVAAHKAVGIGAVAEGLMVPAGVLSGFVSSASMIIGITSLFASFLRYSQYRINPLASPISTVIILFILGLILIGLPFIDKLIGAGVPYKL